MAGIEKRHGTGSGGVKPGNKNRPESGTGRKKQRQRRGEAHCTLAKRLLGALRWPRSHILNYFGLAQEREVHYFRLAHSAVVAGAARRHGFPTRRAGGRDVNGGRALIHGPKIKKPTELVVPERLRKPAPKCARVPGKRLGRRRIQYISYYGSTRNILPHLRATANYSSPRGGRVGT